MRILVIDSRDPGEVGCALRGQEMAFALMKLGHEVVLEEPNRLIAAPLRGPAAPEAVIYAGTWHQLAMADSQAIEMARLCDAQGIPCLWWYGSNGSVFGCVDSDPAVRAASERRIIDLINARPFIGVICPYSMGIYARHGVRPDRMRMVPSTFDGELFAPESSPYDRRVSERLRFKFGIPDDAFVVGTVGNTPNSKGGDDVIRAVALLQGEMPDLHYLVLHTPEAMLSRTRATSPDGKRLGKSEHDVLLESKALAVELGVADRCRFLGVRFPRTSMPQIYRLMNVYASPSKAENLGQPLVESQLCGRPLVTYQGFSFDYVAAPTAEQIPADHTDTDDYGLVIPACDPAVLADALRRARRTAETAGTAETTRTWTYARFHHHNAQIMVDALEEYRAILTGRRQAGVGDQGADAGRGYAAAADRIEREIGVPSGEVLDIGCNSGTGMAVLAQRWPAARLYGIEPVTQYADAARGRGLQVQVATAESIPHLAAVFHFVFARHSLEHCEDRTRAVAEIRRVLRPGGMVYVQCPIEPDGSPNPLHRSPFRSQEEVRDLFPGFIEVYWGPQATVAELIAKRP